MMVLKCPYNWGWGGVKGGSEFMAPFNKLLSNLLQLTITTIIFIID